MCNKFVNEMTNQCEHDLHYVGEQKAEKGNNRYFRCSKCGSVIIRADNGSRFEIPKPAEE
jgi:hypothetical protein